MPVLNISAALKSLSDIPFTQRARGVEKIFPDGKPKTMKSTPKSALFGLTSSWF